MVFAHANIGSRIGFDRFYFQNTEMIDRQKDTAYILLFTQKQRRGDRRKIGDSIS